MANSNDEKINNHYGKVDIFKNIIKQLEHNNIDTNNLTCQDLDSFDQFHIGGKLATKELAQFAQLPEGMKILDIGCGIGGPARTLAFEFKCDVVGVDLTEEYVKAGKKLTELIGISNRIKFHQGDATNLSFDSNQFDYVWLQHITMNIEEKLKLFKEIKRMLKDDGKLVFYEIIKGNDEPISYPVFWSATEELSFLINEKMYRKALEDAGLKEEKWEDKSSFAIDWFQSMLDQMKVDGPPKLGLKVIVADDVPIKAQNILNGLNEEKLRVVRAIYSNG